MNAVGTPMMMFVLPSLVSLLFNIGVLVYLFRKRRKFPQPTRLAMIAFSLMLLVTVSSPISLIFMARWIQSDSFMIINLAAVFLMTGTYMFAMCLLLAAIYVGRSADQRPAELCDAGGGAYQPSNNPYAVPRQD